MKTLIEKFIMRNASMGISEERISEEGSGPNTIYLIGNVESFQSLMHVILVSLNMLEDRINITQLPFIQSKLKKQFLINIDYEAVGSSTGPLIEDGNNITWYLNADSAGFFAAIIHGLGYAYKNHDFIPYEEFDKSTHVIDCLLE